MKSKTISVRLDIPEYAKVIQDAYASGMTESEYLRSLLSDVASSKAEISRLKGELSNLKSKAQTVKNKTPSKIETLPKQQVEKKAPKPKPKAKIKTWEKVKTFTSLVKAKAASKAKFTSVKKQLPIGQTITSDCGCFRVKRNVKSSYLLEKSK